MSNDPHHNEFLAAVAGMQETYGGPQLTPPTVILRDGQPFDTWPVGARVQFEDGRGNERRGVIVEVLDDYETYHVASHTPDHGQDHFAIERRQIVWPF